MGFFFTYFGVLVCRQTYTLTDPTPFTRPRAPKTASLRLLTWMSVWQYNRYYRFVMQYAEPKAECRRRQSYAKKVVTHCKYIVNYYINWVMTSWIYSKMITGCAPKNTYIWMATPALGLRLCILHDKSVISVVLSYCHARRVAQRRCVCSPGACKWGRVC